VNAAVLHAPEIVTEAPGGSAAFPPPKTRSRRLSRPVLAVGAAVIVAGGGLAYLLSPKDTVSTDAAYVEADSAVIAPRVKGLVSQVLVRHDQAVKRGDPLIAIDPEEFDARVAAARADLMNAQAGVASARAALVSLAAEERLAASSVRSAQTLIAAADAQSLTAGDDQARYDHLEDSGAVARRDADRFRAAAIGARSAAEHSRAELEVAKAQSAVTGARRPALDAALAQAQAGVARTQAALALARQDQGHTLIRAPFDGVVGDRQAEPGDYVQPGARLMTLVPMRSLYVVANFKETQVARMNVGQTATVSVDALPGSPLKGEVESLAPGSGSQFSLLPFEPGTGNFTKIVQRVPVRIRLDPGQKGLDRLRPGLSTTVKVRLAKG
jgi:membrane fusion protein (multidrug efflux system)